MEATKQTILSQLLGQDRHVLAVAIGLGIRESAIRRHFDQLEEFGLVEGFFRQEGLGRPKKYYKMTRKGRDVFPRAYARPLERALGELVRSGQARDAEHALHLHARNLVEQSRNRLPPGASVLAKARYLERTLGQLGLATQTRARGSEIAIECTSTAVLCTALERPSGVSDRFRDELIQIVVASAAFEEPVGIGNGSQE